MEHCKQTITTTPNSITLFHRSIYILDIQFLVAVNNTLEHQSRPEKPLPHPKTTKPQVHPINNVNPTKTKNQTNPQIHTNSAHPKNYSETPIPSHPIPPRKPTRLAQHGVGTRASAVSATTPIPSRPDPRIKLRRSNPHLDGFQFSYRRGRASRCVDDSIALLEIGVFFGRVVGWNLGGFLGLRSC